MKLFFLFTLTKHRHSSDTSFYQCQHFLNHQPNAIILFLFFFFTTNKPIFYKELSFNFKNLLFTMKVMNIEIYTIDSLNSGANFSSKISSFNVCIWYLSNDMFNLFSAAIFYIHTRKITLYNHQLPQNGFKVRKYYHSFRRCLCDCSISFSHFSVRYGTYQLCSHKTSFLLTYL